MSEPWDCPSSCGCECAKKEIERLRAALRSIQERADMNSHYSYVELCDTALVGNEQLPVSLAEMRKPEEQAKNERSAAALDAIAAYGQYGAKE